MFIHAGQDFMDAVIREYRNLDGDAGMLGVHARHVLDDVGCRPIERHHGQAALRRRGPGVPFAESGVGQNDLLRFKGLGLLFGADAADELFGAFAAEKTIVQFVFPEVVLGQGEQRGNGIDVEFLVLEEVVMNAAQRACVIENDGKNRFQSGRG